MRSLKEHPNHRPAELPNGFESGTGNGEPGTGNRRVGGIERLARQAATLVEKREVEYFSIEARSILNRCSSDRMPFTWTINPYRGCEFGCRYCYARYTHEYMGLHDPADFENKIYVKRDAARTLLRELTPERLAGQLIALGTATDPYQPAERRFRITRGVLEALARADGVRLNITTKGDLITRDIDVLRQIAARGSLQVNMTVTTVDVRLARVLEFRAPTPQKRLAALRALGDAGLRAGVNIAPILPDLTDSRESLAAVIAAAKEAGATHVFANVLFLKESAQKRFFPFLEEYLPGLAARYARRYARSAYVDAAYKRRVLDLVEQLKQEYGIPDRQDLETPVLVHEAAAQQLFLGLPEPPNPKHSPRLHPFAPPAHQEGNNRGDRNGERDGAPA
jgi:DNA repair photolyase